MAPATMTKPIEQPKPLPAPNSDFYQLADVLTAEEKALVKKVRWQWFWSYWTGQRSSRLIPERPRGQ